MELKMNLINYRLDTKFYQVWNHDWLTRDNALSSLFDCFCTTFDHIQSSIFCLTKLVLRGVPNIFKPLASWLSISLEVWFENSSPCNNERDADWTACMPGNVIQYENSWDVWHISLVLVNALTSQAHEWLDFSYFYKRMSLHLQSIRSTLKIICPFMAQQPCLWKSVNFTHIRAWNDIRYYAVN